jgi:hypothetical protein
VKAATTAVTTAAVLSKRNSAAHERDADCRKRDEPTHDITPSPV